MHYPYLVLDIIRVIPLTKTVASMWSENISWNKVGIVTLPYLYLCPGRHVFFSFDNVGEWMQLLFNLGKTSNFAGHRTISEKDLMTGWECI